MPQIQYLSLAATACIGFGIFYGSITDSETRLFDMPFDWHAAAAGAVCFAAVEVILRVLAARSKRGK